VSALRTAVLTDVAENRSASALIEDHQPV